jgi:hypothetical protein
MLNRIYNVAVLAGMTYFFLDFALWGSLEQRKFDLIAFVLLPVIRYVVRVPSLTAAHSRGEGL